MMVSLIHSPLASASHLSPPRTKAPPNENDRPRRARANKSYADDSRGCPSVVPRREDDDVGAEMELLMRGPGQRGCQRSSRGGSWL